MNTQRMNEIKKEIDTLEVELEMLKENAEQKLIADGLDEFKDDFVSLSFRETKKYEYPAEITEAEAVVKKSKKDYEATATPTITKSLVLKVK